MPAEISHLLESQRDQTFASWISHDGILYRVVILFINTQFCLPHPSHFLLFCVSVSVTEA
jgi:hypothetical protein